MNIFVYIYVVICVYIYLAGLLEITPIGVHRVSVDSDSDHALSDEEPVTPCSTNSALPTEQARKEPAEGLNRPDSPCSIPIPLKTLRCMLLSGAERGAESI